MEPIIGTLLLSTQNTRGPVAAIVAAGLMFLSTGKVLAQESGSDSCPSYGVQQVRFASVLSGDAFLTQDNEEVRLAGILAPDSESGAEDVFETSRSFLERAIADDVLRLAFTGLERDRYGRLSAQVFVAGAWLQGIMLQAGLARAAPDVLTRDCAARLLDAEAAARTANAGHWSDGSFLVLQMESLLAEERRFAGSYQIVEAAIVDVGNFRGRYFLNFGEDRETDFTVTISPQDMRYFRQSAIDLNVFIGRRVRVRGWLESYNGPNMPISIPEAIELID